MKNIIRYFKLLKFGLQARTMIILSLFFLALGIFYEMIDFNSNGLIPFSGLYLGISGMYIYQVVITSSVSALVQVSPFKKKLQCGVPAAFTAVCICITFTIFVVLRLTVGMPRALNENPAADTTIFYIHIMTTAIMLAFIFLYFSFSYRYYVVATIILCIALFPALLIFMRADFPVEEAIISALTKVVNTVGGAGAIALSYLIILAGAFVCYLFNLLLYRKPLSCIAFRSALRQAQAK